MFINYSEVLIAQLLRQFLLNKVVVGLQLSVVLEKLTNLWFDFQRMFAFVKFHIVNDLVEIHAYCQA